MTVSVVYCALFRRSTAPKVRVRVRIRVMVRWVSGLSEWCTFGIAYHNHYVTVAEQAEISFGMGIRDDQWNIVLDWSRD